MKKRLNIVTALLITLIFIGCGEDGTIGIVTYGDLTGKVVKRTSFEELENVKITLSPSSNTAFTDAEGNFAFKGIEVQEYSIQASKEGYLDKFEGVLINDKNPVNVILEMDISTALNSQPTKPSLLTPADGSTGLSNKVILTWESTDIDEDALNFTLEVRNDMNNDVVKIENITENTYELTDLNFGVKYFWQIMVTDGIHQDVTSNVFSFTVTEDSGNRFVYVKKEAGNNVIYSGSFNSSDSASENEIRLTSVSLNSWRPRRNQVNDLIAFLRIDNNEAHIYTMKSNGNDVRKVTSLIPVAGFNLNEIDFSWSHDGGKLLYSNFDKLYMINKDGSGLQMVYQTANGSLISECDWSDGGTKIALKTNSANGYDGAIYTINMNGVVLDTVVTGVAGALGGLHFSASGNKIVYTKDVSGFESFNYRQLDTHVFIYDFSTSIATDISAGHKASGTNDLDPRFSPNEAEVIFVNTSNDGISQKSIVKTSVSGDIERITLFTSATMPDWE